MAVRLDAGSQGVVNTFHLARVGGGCKVGVMWDGTIGGVNKRSKGNRCGDDGCWWSVTEGWGVYEEG